MSTKPIGIWLAIWLALNACVGTVSPASEPAATGTASAGPAEEADSSPDAGEQYAQERQALIEEIRNWGIQDARVLQAIEDTPRHEFVPIEFIDQAYANHPLPIGYGQTISQPFIVALMTRELDLEEGDKVLEIGTGSGYQAAVLAEMNVDVFTIEIVTALAEKARDRMDSLGYGQVEIRNADGYWGWEEEAPFDAIIITAAPDHVPQPLVQQLAIGGVMVVPIGPPGGYQELWRITRVSEDQVQSQSLGGVRFVPLVRDDPSE